MTITRLTFGTAYLLISMVGLAAAQSVEKTDGGITWQAGVDGVKIDFDNDQHVRRIYSKVAQPVTIADSAASRPQP